MHSQCAFHLVLLALVSPLFFDLSMKNSLHSFAKSCSIGVGGNGNCLFLKSSLFVILKTALKLFLFSVISLL